MAEPAPLRSPHSDRSPNHPTPVGAADQHKRDPALIEAALAYAFEWADTGCDNHAGLWYITRCALDGDTTIEEIQAMRDDLAEWHETRAIG